MALFDTLIERYRAERTRSILSTLSDRQLDDIGLSRADVYDPKTVISSRKPTGMRGII